MSKDNALCAVSLSLKWHCKLSVHITQMSPHNYICAGLGNVCYILPRKNLGIAGRHGFGVINNFGYHIKEIYYGYGRCMGGHYAGGA